MTQRTSHSHAPETDPPSLACCDSVVSSTCRGAKTKSGCCGPDTAPKVCGQQPASEQGDGQRLVSGGRRRGLPNRWRYRGTVRRRLIRHGRRRAMVRVDTLGTEDPPTRSRTLRVGSRPISRQLRFPRAIWKVTAVDPGLWTSPSVLNQRLKGIAREPPD
jgi:hypothetical protein